MAAVSDMASGEGPKTGCAGTVGQLSHMWPKCTGGAASGEGSAPGLRHLVVAGDHCLPQCSTDEGLRSTGWHQPPAKTRCVTVVACEEDVAETQPSVDVELECCRLREAWPRREPRMYACTYAWVWIYSEMKKPAGPQGVRIRRVRAVSRRRMR